MLNYLSINHHHVLSPSKDAYPIPNPLPALTSLDSAFQLQEYITLLIKADVHDVQRIISIPTRISDDSEEGGSASGEEEKAADEYCWIYEQLRRVALDLSHPLISALQLECNRNTCPEMKADEWLYLCVAHGTGQNGVIEVSLPRLRKKCRKVCLIVGFLLKQQCCAIDYIVHTLDGATALLNSPKAFPSRYVQP